MSNDNGKLDIRLSGPWREVISGKFLCWRLSVKWYIAIAHPGRRCASPRHAGKQISRLLGLTAGLDMSRFHLMDFGTRRRFLAKYKKPSLSVCNRNPGLWHQQLRSGASAFPHADGNTGHEWFQAHQQISPDLANSQRAHLLPGWKSIPTNLALH